MELVKRKWSSILARCESCGRNIEVPRSNTINPNSPTIDLKDVVQCECGEYHNLIVDTKKHTVINTAPPPPKSVTRQESEALTCPQCGSQQLYTGHKGFSLGKAAAGGLLLGPVGLLGGLIGSKKVIITCLICGYKWQAGKH